MKPSNQDNILNFSIKKKNRFLTESEHGYLSDIGRERVALLISQGFDPDLAYIMAKSWTPEVEFYNLDAEVQPSEAGHDLDQEVEDTDV